MIDRLSSISANCNSFQNYGNIELLPKASDVSPIEARLIHSVGDSFSTAHVSLRNVSFSPAINVGINSKTDGVITTVDGAPNMIIHPRLIAADIQLKYL